MNKNVDAYIPTELVSLHDSPDIFYLSYRYLLVTDVGGGGLFFSPDK